MKINSFRLHARTSPLAKRLVAFAFSLLLMKTVIGLTILPAHAIEEPHFAPAIEAAGPTLRLQLSAFLDQNYKAKIESYMLSEVELNGDGRLEYVLKRKNCGQYTEICTFLIIADQDSKLGLLSEINARHIMIGDGNNYGINNILAFKNRINAYDFDIYMWSPREKMYILSGGEIKN